jgi:hypothetical protein
MVCVRWNLPATNSSPIQLSRPLRLSMCLALTSVQVSASTGSVAHVEDLRALFRLG